MSNPKNLSLSYANQALLDVVEGVEELEAECYRLRAELKTSNAERDELRQQVENIKNGFEGSCYACEPVGEMNKKLREERDEARRVLKAIVEEFVQHEQAMNPSYPATPMHECEFSWNPECGKCDACEAWGDYVRICHPNTDTEEDETP